MMQTILFSLFLLLQATPLPRSLQVTLVDADNRPIVAQSLQLEIQTPFTQQECVTDDAGVCEFHIASDQVIVRGRLIVMGRGVRPVTWRGESLALPLMLDENNAFAIPLDFANEQSAATSVESHNNRTPRDPYTAIVVSATTTPFTQRHPLTIATVTPLATTTTHTLLAVTSAPTITQSVTPTEHPTLSGWEIFSFLLVCAIGVFMLLLIYVLLEGPR